MDIEYKNVENREQLVKIIQSLSRQDTAEWENSSISSFLEALAAWIDDAEGFYANSSFEVNSDNPSWQLFADALQAAAVYE